MPKRVDRINGLLRQQISELLSRGIKDPRLNALITITQVQTSSDLRSARVFVSVMGDQETKDSAMEGLRSAATFMRRELRDRLSLRYVPFMTFMVDNTIEDATRLLTVLDSLGGDTSSAQSKHPEPSASDGPLSFPPTSR